MTFGLIPNPLWHLLAVIPPILIWWVGQPWAKRRHITLWHNASLGVSFWEEVLFRGLTYGLILWVTHSTLVTIIGSSALFGVFHLRNLWWADWRRVALNCLYTGLIAGPIFALVRFWSGDIYLGILVHFLHNFINMRLAHDTPTDEFLASKRINQNWFERFFAGYWLPPTNHHIIYIPGLHDQVLPQRLATKLLPFFWRWRGFQGHIMAPSWEVGNFESKLQAVFDKINELGERGHMVSLVGQSAGSSLALNAFAARREFVAGLVVLTGRLRVAGQPSLEQAAKGSPAFAESVRRAEVVVNNLTAADKARIITIRPAVDKVVPASSIPIKGATNLKSRLRGHSLGGAMLASFASGQWLAFLRSLRGELTMADLVVEAMPFSNQIIAWCHAHPEFMDALKVTNPERFYPLGMVLTSKTKNMPKDLVIGFIAYDMIDEIFKQDFIVDVGDKAQEFVLYTRLPSRSYGKYVRDIKDFYARYGKDGNYAGAHHVDLNYILGMNNQELSERAKRAMATSKQIVTAGGRRTISQRELKETLANIRAEKAKLQQAANAGSA